VKEISAVLTQFLQAAFFLVNSVNEEKDLISPLNQKQVNPEKIWDIERFVREFEKLKINILAYIQTNNKSKGLAEEIDKEKKNCSFKPKLTKKKIEKEGEK
jgi:hypothetical protein